MKHLLYLKYLIRHKWFVFLACVRHGIAWQGIIHDWTKFLPSEWFPYVEYFYGHGLPGDQQRALERFNRGWLEHQHRSPHHWQHWVLRNDDGTTVALSMPRRYVLEMLADWEGAGRAITGKKGTTLAWYAKNREKMLLDEDVRDFVERALNYGNAPHFLKHGALVSIDGLPVRVIGEVVVLGHAANIKRLTE